jgi:hypothetical protein
VTAVTKAVSANLKEVLDVVKSIPGALLNLNSIRKSGGAVLKDFMAAFGAGAIKTLIKQGAEARKKA